MQASNPNTTTISDIKSIIDHCKEQGVIEFKYADLYFRLAPHVPPFPSDPLTQASPAPGTDEYDRLLFMSSK